MSLNVELIRASFEKAKPIADQVADKFYEFLWSDNPVSETLFVDVKMDGQKKALINSLVFIVDHVDQPDQLVPYLESMGERHVKYGAKEEHYDWVGSALIKTFAHFFGDEWTDELQEQWVLAYNFIAQTMIDGARKATPEIGDIKDRAKNVCNQLLKELLEQGIDEEFEVFVRAKVRKILLQALDEESQELLGKAG